MGQLIIKDLWAKIDDKIILKGVNLTINEGEIHCIMGPNGAGKSTLSSVIMGDPKYQVIKGTITFNNEDVLSLEVDKRAKLGIFLAMQYPSEITGITNSDFIRHAMQALGKQQNLFQYVKALQQACNDLEMDKKMLHRYVNEGFSGGEKKRNEILQMKMLAPQLAILDEIDSGLDIDALRIVGKNLVMMHQQQPTSSYLIITHYKRLLDYITPTHIHIMIDGKITKSGGMELANQLEQEGYQSLINNTKENDATN